MSILVTMIICTSVGWAFGRVTDRPRMLQERWLAITLAIRVAWLRLRARRYSAEGATIVRMREKERL